MTGGYARVWISAIRPITLRDRGRIPAPAPLLRLYPVGSGHPDVASRLPVDSPSGQGRSRRPRSTAACASRWAAARRGGRGRGPVRRSRRGRGRGRPRRRGAAACPGRPAAARTSSRAGRPGANDSPSALTRAMIAGATCLRCTYWMRSGYLRMMAMLSPPQYEMWPVSRHSWTSSGSVPSRKRSTCSWVSTWLSAWGWNTRVMPNSSWMARASRDIPRQQRVPLLGGQLGRLEPGPGVVDVAVHLGQEDEVAGPDARERAGHAPAPLEDVVERPGPVQAAVDGAAGDGQAAPRGLVDEAGRFGRQVAEGAQLHPGVARRSRPRRGTASRGLAQIVRHPDAPRIWGAAQVDPRQPVGRRGRRGHRVAPSRPTVRSARGWSRTDVRAEYGRPPRCRHGQGRLEGSRRSPTVGAFARGGTRGSRMMRPDASRPLHGGSTIGATPGPGRCGPSSCSRRRARGRSW